MFERLAKAPSEGNPRTYVTIHEGVGGWNSGIWCWQVADNPTPGFAGFYEPQITGFNNTSLGTGLRKHAIREAVRWAMDEDLPVWIPEGAAE